MFHCVKKIVLGLSLCLTLVSQGKAEFDGIITPCTVDKIQPIAEALLPLFDSGAFDWTSSSLIESVEDDGAVPQTRYKYRVMFSPKDEEANDYNMFYMLITVSDVVPGQCVLREVHGDYAAE
jgi:hypothetical protein